MCQRKKLWTRTYSTRDQVPTCPVFTRAKIKFRFGILKNLPSQFAHCWMVSNLENDYILLIILLWTQLNGFKHIKWFNNSIWPMNGTTTGTTTPSQSGPGSNDYGKVLHTPQRSWTEASPYLGHLLGGGVCIPLLRCSWCILLLRRIRPCKYECWLKSSHDNIISIFTNPSAWAGYETRSIFKQSLTGLNSEFSFS